MAWNAKDSVLINRAERWERQGARAFRRGLKSPSSKTGQHQLARSQVLFGKAAQLRKTKLAQPREAIDAAKAVATQEVERELGHF